MTAEKDLCSYCNQNILGDDTLDQLDRQDREKHRSLLGAFPICVECFDIYSEAKRLEDKETLLLFNQVREALVDGPARTRMTQLQQVLEADVAEKQHQAEERAFREAVALRLNSQTLLLREVRDEDERCAELEMKEFLSAHPEYVGFFEKKAKREKPTCEKCVHYAIDDDDDEDDEEYDEEYCALEEERWGKAHQCPSYHKRED